MEASRNQKGLEAIEARIAQHREALEVEQRGRMADELTCVAVVESGFVPIAFYGALHFRIVIAVRVGQKPHRLADLLLDRALAVEQLVLEKPAVISRLDVGVASQCER